MYIYIINSILLPYRYAHQLQKTSDENIATILDVGSLSHGCHCSYLRHYKMWCSVSLLETHTVTVLSRSWSSSLIVQSTPYKDPGCLRQTYWWFVVWCVRGIEVYLLGLVNSHGLWRARIICDRWYIYIHRLRNYYLLFYYTNYHTIDVLEEIIHERVLTSIKCLQ